MTATDSKKLNLCPTVPTEWTKDNPLPVADRHKLREVKGGQTVKADIFMLCPCSDRPFKYAHLCSHKKGVKHQRFMEAHPDPPTPPDLNKLRHTWYKSDEIDTLIKDTKRLPDTLYNTEKLKRLERVKESGYFLCRCGSACKSKIKAHLKTDIHKSWVLHGSPSRVILRVRGMPDLITEKKKKK